MELIGIDILAMPRAGARRAGSVATGGQGGFAGFMFEPYETWIAPARLRQLGWDEGTRVPLESGALLPPVRAVAGEDLGHRVLIDIGALQSLTDSAGRLSSILVFDTSAERLQALRAVLPAHLRWVAERDRPDPEALTRSFHLNLGAMGLLAFVVGVFLIYNALSFSYTDRRDLIRRMRLAGATRAELARALLAELGLFVVIGSALGAWLGGLVAVRLLPGVGRTLAQLYGVYIDYPDRIVSTGLWTPLVMTGVAALLCVSFPLRRALIEPLLQRRTIPWRRRAAAVRDRGLFAAGLALLGAAWAVAGRAGTAWVALAGMACLLLGAAFCLPAVLRAALSALARGVPARRPVAGWLIADSRWLLGPAATALMALTLVLVANSGLNTMIGSFRQATDDWLRQRLAAELYLRGGHDAGAVRRWVSESEPGVSVFDRYRTRVTRRNASGRIADVEVVTLQDDPRFFDAVKLVSSQPRAMERFAGGEGVLVSERAWRLEGWQPGDRVRLCDAHEQVAVLGVYHDYGNPLAQWMASRALFRECWPEITPAGLALVGPDTTDWDRVRSGLTEAFELREGDLLDQRELRGIGMAVFEHTFTVTHALNALTLLVVCIGVFCAVSAIHHHRIRQQAVLASLGLTRRERGALLLLQWGMLGALSMMVVWPLGTALAGYLAGVVTPAAFGWSFPLKTSWWHFLTLTCVAVASLALAVALPSLGLMRTSPAAMLREHAA